MRKHFDKGLHLIINLFGVVILTDFVGLWLAIMIMLLISIGKEIYDKLKTNPTGFNWWDLLADLIGIVIGIIIRS